MVSNNSYLYFLIVFISDILKNYNGNSKENTFKKNNILNISSKKLSKKLFSQFSKYINIQFIKNTTIFYLIIYNID